MKALLFTDVVDSTLTEQLGDARAAQVWSEHDRHARDLMRAHRARENRDAARATWAQAERACARVATDVASELGQRMVALRQVLAAAAPPSAANP